jgi:hypothetical protein
MGVGSTTWSNQEVAYVIGAAVLGIEPEGSLTLGDGVVLKFDGGRIDLSGSITQGDDVQFTSLFDDSLLGDTNGDGDATEPAPSAGDRAPAWLKARGATRPRRAARRLRGR